MAPHLTVEMKKVVLDMKAQGLSTVEICRAMKTIFNVEITRQGIWKFLKKQQNTCTTTESISRKKNHKNQKFLDIHRQVLDLWMAENKDLTARDLQRKFLSEMGINFSIPTIKFHRRQMKWSMKRKRYCQLISYKNKHVRMNWCMDMLNSSDTFSDVIFVDESNIELSSTSRLSFYKIDVSMDRIPRRAAKPKHSYTVHVWGGISYKGRTNICIFTGIMDSVIYQKILQDNLLPFVREKFPDGFRLYQDNDAKHKSKSTRQWMEEKGILDSVMTTPASSPDINPIENVWSTMKDYLQREVKPKTKDQLVDGIRQYWETLTVEKCRTFIDHIHKVLPVIVLNSGEATDY